jgi:GT2 family glycosyltransferase
MTETTPVSLIIVSRHRANALRRCLTGVAQLDHPNFEVIVAADPDGLAVARDFPVKAVPFDKPNVAAARNAALAEAAGEIVAFIDDDAVPEPTWLTRLTAPFADPTVTLSTGFVLGRNGISYQWKAFTINALGQTQPLEVASVGVTVLPPTPERVVKALGTNCAFRRDTVLAAGGFDPAFRFYLDDADLSLRLARRGAVAAIVPGAVVHHGFLSSARRRADRAPRDLFDIGASVQAFLLRHAKNCDQKAALAAVRAEERRRLIRHIQTGALEPRDVARMMLTLDMGIAEGRGRAARVLPGITATTTAFRRLPAGPRPGQVFAGRTWQAAARRRQAAEAVRQGKIASLFLFSPTGLYHRVCFNADGVWEQRGGLFGRSLRDGPLWQFSTFAARVLTESARVCLSRPVQ